LICVNLYSTQSFTISGNCQKLGAIAGNSFKYFI
jgi:hypothetical protein